MMKDNESDDSAKLAGCGLTILSIVGLLVLAVVAAVVYVLFNIGTWIGGQ